MKLSTSRVHVAGSASSSTDPDALSFAHETVRETVQQLADAGARFMVTPGREPRLTDTENDLAIVFDWTVLETLAESLTRGTVKASSDGEKLVVAVVTHKLDTHIPESRRELWDQLLAAGAIQVEYPESIWSSGAHRRRRAADFGDILICLSGGEGVEHLAQIYSRDGKPVIPLDLALGSSSEDGSGGATALYARACSKPEHFAVFADEAVGSELFSAISTRQLKVRPFVVSSGILDLIGALAEPTVFYVRLVDREHEDWDQVEAYFRGVVDRVVERMGYRPIEIGRSNSSSAWMNVDIFEGLHRAPLALVDLTGLRNNCFMELGYAFGLGRHVLLTARHGTKVPFDSSTIEYRSWKGEDPDSQRQLELEDYWKRNLNRRELVEPHGIFD